VQSKERTPITSVEELRGNKMIPTGPQSVSIDVELPTEPYLSLPRGTGGGKDSLRRVSAHLPLAVLSYCRFPGGFSIKSGEEAEAYEPSTGRKTGKKTIFRVCEWLCRCSQQPSLLSSVVHAFEKGEEKHQAY